MPLAHVPFIGRRRILLMAINLPMPFLELQDNAVPVQEDKVAGGVRFNPAARFVGEVRVCKGGLGLVFKRAKLLDPEVQLAG